MFTFNRRRFHQVVLIGALSIGSGFVIHLFSLRSADQPELVYEAYFLVAIGILYGLVWLGARYLSSGSPPSSRGKR
jgi:hypothetical protein